MAEKLRKHLPGKPFEKGNKNALGHSGKGTGRPPDWLKKKCQELVDRNKLIDWLASVASGKENETVISQGETYTIPASQDTRLRALNMLLDRGYGKVPQPVTGENGVPIVVTLTNYGSNPHPV
jgi:hypothetical protein